MSGHLLENDLNEVLNRLGRDWERLRGTRIFLTGGTGFFGRWLLESLLHANRELSLGACVTVLTRNPEKFQKESARLAGERMLSVLQGDVRNPWKTWSVPEPSGFRFVIHAATDADAGVNERSPEIMIATIVDGTRHALEFAVENRAERFLLTSSGAVYGRQPPDLPLVTEDWTGGPALDDPRSAYAEGKRLAELLCVLSHRKTGLSTVVARCFAFLGPYLPLDRQYAAGNFLRDALAGGPIRIQGDGTPMRSYLYPSELAIGLWTILLRGTPARPYNVGSEIEVSIEALAREIASHFDPAPSIEIARQAVPGIVPERYVPSTERARSELGLSQRVSLHDAIARTVAWHRAGGIDP